MGGCRGVRVPDRAARIAGCVLRLSRDDRHRMGAAIMTRIHRAIKAWVSPVLILAAFAFLMNLHGFGWRP